VSIGEGEGGMGPASGDWRTTAWLILVDIAVGASWALLLAATVLFIVGVSQFIYVDF